jgi:hypothetical protein
VVRAEGLTEIDEDAPPADEIPGYVEKCRRTAISWIGFDPGGFARLLRGREGQAYPAGGSAGRRCWQRGVGTAERGAARYSHPDRLKLR